MGGQLEGEPGGAPPGPRARPSVSERPAAPQRTASRSPSKGEGERCLLGSARRAVPDPVCGAHPPPTPLPHHLVTHRPAATPRPRPTLPPPRPAPPAPLTLLHVCRYKDRQIRMRLDPSNSSFGSRVSMMTPLHIIDVVEIAYIYYLGWKQVQTESACTLPGGTVERSPECTHRRGWPSVRIDNLRVAYQHGGSFRVHRSAGVRLSRRTCGIGRCGCPILMNGCVDHNGCEFIVLVIFISNDQTSKGISPLRKVDER